MRTHEALEDRRLPADRGALPRCVDGCPAVSAFVVQTRCRPGGATIDPDVAGLETVLLQAMRPFLSRCADAIMARTNFQGWPHGNLPALCGGEPDFAVITPAAERLLICCRCTARWRFHQIACPFCLNDERTKITSFASRDGMYRLNGCDVCQRYIKAYDARRAARQDHAGRRRDRHAAAGCGGDAERLSITTPNCSSDASSELPTRNGRLSAPALWSLEVGSLGAYCCWASGPWNRSTAFCVQPVEQVPRLPEAAGVRLRAEDDDRDRVALRQAQQRRQAVARLGDEAGLAAHHVDVAVPHSRLVLWIGIWRRPTVAV